MVKIAIFYHIYQSGKWKEIFKEQFGLIESSGLYDAADHIHFGINGPMKFNYPKVGCVINDNKHMEETETLKSLLEFSEGNPGYKVLYIHTKGATKNLKPVDDWRKMMNHFVIKNWKSCLNLLEDNDAVGCNYSEETFLGRYPHFSGNFWWSTTDYIKTLNHDYLKSDRRWDREFWIGTGSGKLLELHNSGVDHYHYEYPENFYRERDD